MCTGASAEIYSLAKDTLLIIPGSASNRRSLSSQTNTCARRIQQHTGAAIFALVFRRRVHPLELARLLDLADFVFMVAASTRRILDEEQPRFFVMQAAEKERKREREKRALQERLGLARRRGRCNRRSSRSYGRGRRWSAISPEGASPEASRRSKEESKQDCDPKFDTAPSLSRVLGREESAVQAVIGVPLGAAKFGKRKATSRGPRTTTANSVFYSPVHLYQHNS